MFHNQKSLFFDIWIALGYSIDRPSIVQVILQKYKIIMVKIECFQGVDFSPIEQNYRICKQIHPKIIPNNDHETSKDFHISVRPTEDIGFCTLDKSPIIAAAEPILYEKSALCLLCSVFPKHSPLL